MLTDAMAATWLLGLILLLFGLFVFRQRALYQRQRSALIELLDRTLGQLLPFLQEELPASRSYVGETRSWVEAAAAAADAALYARQEGERELQEADRLARYGRFWAAASRLNQAQAACHQSDAALQRAKEAWAPVAYALGQGGEIVGRAQAATSAAEVALAGEQTRTGWPLDLLADRVGQASGLLHEASSLRDIDPVHMVTLAEQAEARAAGLRAELAAIRGLSQTLVAQQRSRQEAGQTMVTIGQSFGLRFVEVSPDAALARAQVHEEAFAERLRQGDCHGAERELIAAHGAVKECYAILERYRVAVERYPQMRSALSASLSEVAGEATDVDAILAQLASAYAKEDSSEHAGLPSALRTFQRTAEESLAAVAQLTQGGVQRYLEAFGLLERRLAERTELSRALSRLIACPGELAALADQASQNCTAADQSFTAAYRAVNRGQLQLGPALAQRYDDAHARLRELQAMAGRYPLPVRSWARQAAEAVGPFTALQQEVEELERVAVSARARLQRMQERAAITLDYEGYDRNNGINLRESLGTAEAQIAAGQYSQAIEELEQAQRFAVLIEEARRAHHLREEIRKREKAEREARRRSRRYGKHRYRG